MNNCTQESNQSSDSISILSIFSIKRGLSLKKEVKNYSCNFRERAENGSNRHIAALIRYILLVLLNREYINFISTDNG